MVDKKVFKGVVKGLLKISIIFIILVVFILLFVKSLPETDYREFPLLGSRIAIWIIAQLHLLFAAFVLGIPIFAVITEFIGIRTKDAKYDNLAREFTKLLSFAFTITAIFGAILFFLIVLLYPKFFDYMEKIFSPTFYLYCALIFGEVVYTYLYYYSWDTLSQKKGLHLVIGILLNVFGTALMFLANSWATFMMSPGGVTDKGKLLNFWSAFMNHTWWPINIHRVIANICFGGFIVAAYAAYRFLSAKTQEERAHYDWMGYTGNFIGVSALIPLPFAGYWLGREIYAFNEQMGIVMMGGIFSWLFIIQAILIAVLFIGTNYYFWVGMNRIAGAKRFVKYQLSMLIILFVCVAIWMTPHTLVASLAEARKIGAAHHPLLGVFGIMSAKNTAVNIIILTTFLSFIFYRRANKIDVVNWAKTGKLIQSIIFGLVAAVVIFFGVYGYFVPAITRIGFSVYQVLAVLFALVSVTTIDIFLFRRAKKTGEIEWGKIPPRSQYVLILLAVTVVLLMGLMGYLRSGLRQEWHIYTIMHDTHPGAYTPTLGFASQIISITCLIFFSFVAFIFWLGEKSKKNNYEK